MNEFSRIFNLNVRSNITIIAFLVTELKPDWLVEIAPHYYQMKDVEDPGSKKMPRGQGRASSQLGS
uniref:Uncharacterized protein n=1 Tax=Salix viminalis TaxID=40686 RepID=A0A6N2KMH9_SALVM